MPSKPLKLKKKITTLDDFAAAIHKDYLAISANMATKDDIAKLATEVELDGVKATLKDVQENVQQITDNMVSKADLVSAIRDEFGKSEHGKRIDELHARVDRIEGKLGMKHIRPAA